MSYQLSLRKLYEREPFNARANVFEMGLVKQQKIEKTM